MANALWDRRNVEHQKAMIAILAPLIVASRSRDFATPELTHNQMHAWIPALQDVSGSVIEAGVDRLVSRGVTWMPKPGDLRAVCSEIVRERRAAVAKQAAEWKATCETCAGSGLAYVTDAAGVERVTRCVCVTRGIEAVAAAGLQIPCERPALPEWPPELVSGELP